MKPSSKCALAAVWCLAALAAAFGYSCAFASSPSFTARPLMGQGRSVTFRPMRPQQGTPRPSNNGTQQFRFGYVPARNAHRFVHFYGGYAPYYSPAFVSAPLDEEPAGAPIFVETETPINVDIGLRTDRLATPPLCSGPQIIELIRPKMRHLRLPSVIYGTPSPCYAARSVRRGPGIYSFD